MSQRNYIPAKETRIEIRVVNSRFIATLAPAFSVEEARVFIERIKDEFSDASHNVPAFVVGHGSSVTAHCNDDGEPSGTAGRPALAVLQGSGLGDAVVVVTRYFGGTKLGTGGLVRAYGDAVRAVIEAVPRAEKVPTYMVMLSVPYSLFEQARLLVTQCGGQVIEESFAAEVTLTIQFRVELLPGFQDSISGLSHGKVEAIIVESNPDTIMQVKQPEDDPDLGS